MRKKNIFLACGLFFITTLLMNTLIMAAELDQVRQSIQMKGAKWVAGETSVSMLPSAERKKRTALLLPNITGRETLLSFATPAYELGASVDWRNSGGNYITPIRDQGSCGSCWAFATSAGLESSVLIANNAPNMNLDLAEQVLVSCGGVGNCGGGFVDSASDFIRDKGLPVESCYPYTATNGSCTNACVNWQTSTYKIASWSWVATTSPTVTALKNAVFSQGPIVTTMAVYSDFFSYSSGIYSYVSGGFQGNHAVLIVGYDDPGQYFIVKNSWGLDWGESGYFRIAYSELNSPVNFGYYSIAYVGMGDSLPCNYSLSQLFSASGGTGNLRVTTANDCNWTAQSNVNWITITSGSSGTGNGTATYTVTANSGTALRTGSITAAGLTFAVTQEAGQNCTYSISPTSQSFSASGGSGNVNAAASSGCSWAAVSNVSWITITSGSSGSGNGTVIYSVSSNTGTSSRTGTMTVAGSTFTVTQSGQNCTYSISPTSQSFSASGGSGNVNVAASSGCGWTAVSNVSWITITSGGSGSGNGMVNYSVPANTGGSPRTGTMTIAGQTFTVNQDGGSCSYIIAPMTGSFMASGGVGLFSVLGGPGCNWTAVSNSPWVTITSGVGGSGYGLVNYSVAAYNGSYRTGTMTIAGQTFTIYQWGPGY